MKLGGRCIVQKSRRSSNVGVIAPWVRTPKYGIGLRRLENQRRLSSLLTNRKSRIGFRSVPKLVTLSYLEQSNGRHYALCHTKRQFSEPTASNSLTRVSVIKTYFGFLLYVVYGGRRALSLR